MNNNVEKHSSWQIKAGTIMSYLAIVINMGAGLIYTPWMIKNIGQSSYGLYTLASSLISIFMVDFGISSAISKFVSQYLARKEYEKINNFLGMVYKLYLIIDIIICVCLSVVYINLDVIYTKLSVKELEQFKMIFIIVVGYNLISFPFVTLSGVLTSYEKFFQLKVCNIINKIGTVLTTVVVLIIGGGLYSLVFINVLWNLCTIAVKYYLVRSQTLVRANMKYWDSQELKSLFSFSIWATVISIMSRLIFNIMPSVLAAVAGATSVAIFGVASTLEGYVYTFSDAINGMFLSKTVRVLQTDDKEENLIQLMIKVGRINLSIVAFVVIGFMCAGKNFISLWMGESYILAYYCTMLMILPDLIYCPQQIGRTTLVAQNKIKYQAYIYFFVCVVNVITAIILTPRIGVLGAGVAIGITYTIRLILMSVVYHRVLKIDMKRFFKECYVSMLIPIFITLIVGVFLFNIFESNSWMFFILKCISISMVYIISMWLWAWNSYEKEMFLSVAKKIMSKMRR